MITSDEIRRQLEEAGIPFEEYENAGMIAKTGFISACARAANALALSHQSTALNRLADVLEKRQQALLA